MLLGLQYAEMSHQQISSRKDSSYIQLIGIVVYVVNNKSGKIIYTRSSSFINLNDISFKSYDITLFNRQPSIRKALLNSIPTE